ncbi:lava lamp isoform 1-T3 [Glossina fuscipes fuscipes]
MSSETNEPTADINNLQETFLQQQEKISALKEMVRKSEVAHGSTKCATQEKVKHIADRLKKSKARSRQGVNVATYSTSETTPSSIFVNSQDHMTAGSQVHLSVSSPTPIHSSTPNPTPSRVQPAKQMSVDSSGHSVFNMPGNEKILLMRQQLEQNKLRMAKKASSKQHLELMVTQLKEKFDSTQQCLENTFELGKSMNDLSSLLSLSAPKERHKSATDLSNQCFSLERERIKFLENRCRLLEKQLEKEKQNYQNTDSLSVISHEMEIKISELEQSLVEKQNENFRLKQEIDTKEEALSLAPSDSSGYTELIKENESLKKKILEMQNELDNVSQQMLRSNDNLNELYSFDLGAENQRLRQEICQQLKRIEEQNEVNDLLETARRDLTSKVIELEEQVSKQRIELAEAHESLHCYGRESEGTENNFLKNCRPSDTDTQISDEMAKQIQELTDERNEILKENSQLKDTFNKSVQLQVSDNSIADKIASLESTIEKQNEELLNTLQTLKKNEEELMEKRIELNVLNANFNVLEEKLENVSKTKHLFSTVSCQEIDKTELQMEIQELKQKLDESNKTMIKLKLKCKQGEKLIEKLKKNSDLHAEVVRLQVVREELQQRIIELEDEKGQWQLHEVDKDSNDSRKRGELIEHLELNIAELQKSLQEKDCLLESFKQGDQSRVQSELSEIQLEEQIKSLSEQLKFTQTMLESKNKEVEECERKIMTLNKQKDELDKKLEHYLNENMELLDKVEKLSKSSSSAESIEIVERLTQQEQAEIEEFNKRLDSVQSTEAPSINLESINELTQTDMNPELSESLVKLKEESSELMSKIELFTNERKEVLDKMEHLNSENHELQERINKLTEDKKELECKLSLAKQTEEELGNKMQTLTQEKETLAVQVAESQKAQHSQELTSMQQSSEVVAALDNSETLFEKCEKSLAKLNSELEAYRKANDKKSKFNVSKKLAKEAENAHTQLSELLQKVKEASSAVETVTVVETVVAVTAPNGKALAEYEQLTAQNRELKSTIVELRRLLDETRESQDRDQMDDKTIDEPAAILPTISEEQLQEALNNVAKYQSQCIELHAKVEDLTRQLEEARTNGEEKTAAITDLNEELQKLRQLSENFDCVINEKEMSCEKHLEQLTRVRRELECKCETYEGEMEILRTLVIEQKQQLIEAYKENEHAMNIKLLELQERERHIEVLKAEVVSLKESFSEVGSKFNQNLQKDYEQLRETLKINKNLVQDQINELDNKQETIDTLNQQIKDLYKAMEDNINTLTQKEEQIAELENKYEINMRDLAELEKKFQRLECRNQELERLNKDQKDVLNSQKQEMTKLLADKQQLENRNCELEQRNRDQLEKLKKYAANLKKKIAQCQEYEARLKELETTTSTSLDVQDLQNLRLHQTELEQKLGDLQHLISEKENNLLEKSEELIDCKKSKQQLEQETMQLKVMLAENETYLKQLQNDLTTTQQLAADWSDSSEVDQLRKELRSTQENMKLKVQEIEELHKTVASSKMSTEKLQAELLSVQQDISNWRQELYSTQTQLKLKTQELESRDRAIEQLQYDLMASREQNSDWGLASTNEQLREDMLCAQENLRMKVQEIEDLRQSLMAAQEQLSDWGNKSLVKSADYENLSTVLTDKTVKLEKAEFSLNELQNDLLNLRKKDQESCQQINELTNILEEKERTIEEARAKAPDDHYQSNIDSLQKQLGVQEAKLNELTEELKAKSLKFEKSKAVIKERNGQIQRLQAQLKDLQEKLSSLPEEEMLSPTIQARLDAASHSSNQNELETLQQSYNKLNEKYHTEKTNFQETITRLENLHDGIQAKLQEDMAYIETLEQENTKFKDKICRLEECVAIFEERRASMERKVKVMDAQMQQNTEEHAKVEDELIYRLNMLSEHDDVIAQRLLDSQTEKELLEERVRQLQADMNEWQSKYISIDKEFTHYKTCSNDEYEQEVKELRNQVSHLKSDIEHLKSEYEAKLTAKGEELDDLESELSEQLQEMNANKRELSEQLERKSDECNALKDEIVRLNETINDLEQAKSELEREIPWLRMQNDNSQQDLYELQELRLQTIQDKTEIENLRIQIESLTSNHENELQALRTQIAELDTLRMQVGQNQTDDQVFIETENKRLTDLLAEKEALIENYERHNSQSQVATARTISNAPCSTSGQSDHFTLTFGIPTSSVDVSEVDRLGQELSEKNNLVVRLQQNLEDLQIEFDELLNSHNEVQRELSERAHDVINVEALQSVSNTLSESNDVIPAPPMFFTTDTSVRSPFDDIVQARDQTDDISLAEHPTIEDLQRNVSDLEKHAQDLEHKLVVRSQREGENEKRLRDLENRYQQSQSDLNKLNKENADLLQKQSQHAVMEKDFENLENEVQRLQTLLQNRDEVIRDMSQQDSNNDQLKISLSRLEDQIISETPMDPAAQPTLDMFFGNSMPDVFESLVMPTVATQPVIEELIVPKKTYDCQPRQDVTPAIDLGIDWSDGWEKCDAEAEVEHFAKMTTAPMGTKRSLIPKEQQLELQMQELNERIQELQLALERSEEQKKELHIKSGKLMKKLKDYKTRIEELQTSSAVTFRKSSSVESNSVFGDLDAAIQDELKAQIKILEEQLEEQRRLQESQNIEKEKLLKRIDVVTAGNERMSEMKERQDMEVRMYQTRIHELQQKLNTLEEWGTEATIKEVIPITASAVVPADVKNLEERISTLSLEVQDLTGDRLELQALLEEEKINLAKAEETVVSLRQQIMSLEEDQVANQNTDATKYNNLRLEMHNLQESYNNLLNAHERLSKEMEVQADSLAQSQANEVKQKDEIESLLSEVETSREILNNTKQSLIDLEAELSALKEQKEKQIDATTNLPVTVELDLLKKEVSTLQDEKQRHVEANQNLQSEIEILKDEVRRLQIENESLKTSLDIKSQAEVDEDLLVQLQEKDSEIVHLKQRVSDLMNEDQTEKLVLEILTKNQEIHMLKMQAQTLEEDKLELINNLELEKRKSTEETKGRDGVEIQKLQSQNEELLNEKQQMEIELQALNQHVLDSLQLEDKLKMLTLELDTKNIEIAELRKTIETTKLQSNLLQSDASTDYAALSAHWQTIVDQSCGEIAKMWQDHLAQRERDFKVTEARLQEEIASLKNNQNPELPVGTSAQVLSAETTTTSTPASESTTVSGTSSEEASKNVSPVRIITEENDTNTDAIIEKMQAALESQELEIVTLKEQLAIRSAEYARLAAQYDPFKLQSSTPEMKRNIADVAMVPKSELDLALYMLHQRDMRCEEMTLELVSLLEERDTLQLKLSNTLRQIETIKSQSNIHNEASSATVGSPANSPMIDNLGNISMSSSPSITCADDVELNQKLSQLQTVKHSKDKVIREEREQRIRQMEKIQQDVAKMPSAAVSEIIGTDLSQINQSPSAVLLNWLWGNKSNNSGGLQSN